MEKALNILPNFTILADNSPEYINNLMGYLRCFCEVVSNVEHVDNYKITPKSFWQGMNKVTDEDFDFVRMLEDNSKSEIPSNVLTELKKFQSKFGKATLIGDDCLKIDDADLLKEMQSSTDMSSKIYNIEGNLVFFQGIDFEELANLFEYEFSHPIKVHRSRRNVFILRDVSKVYATKSKNPVSALRQLYNKHNLLNEEDLRRRTKNKKKEITEEDVTKYLELMFKSNIFRVDSLSYQSTWEPIAV